MNDTPLPRKRAPHEAYAFARSARRFVTPFQAMVSQWTGEVARLRATAMLHGERMPAGRVRALFEDVRRTHAAFLAGAGIQPVAVAEHSITRDLDRAFRRLLGQLADLAAAAAVAPEPRSSRLPKPPRHLDHHLAP
jgi:hypothetical protein